MSVPNRITSVTHGVTSITGVTGFDITTNDTLEPVHIDTDKYNSYNNVELGGIQITLNGVDFEQYQALINAAAANLVIVCTECGAATSTTFTLANAIAVSESFSAGEQGQVGTGSIVFGGVGADGSTEGLTIASA